MIVNVKVSSVRRLPNASGFEFETDLGRFTTPPNSILNSWIPPEKRLLNRRFLFKIEERVVTSITEIEE